MRKLLALSLAVILTLSLAVPAFAYENNNGYENNETSVAPIIAASTKTAFGYIGEITEADGYHEVQILDEDGDVIAEVKIPIENAVILDSTTGTPADINGHAGNQVHVTFNPQTNNALVLALNVEYMYVPHFHTIEDINRYGDTLVLTVENGSLNVTLNEFTKLHSWLTRQIVVKEEFRVGDIVLLWYAFVGTSHPAQTTAIRALRLVPAQHETDNTGKYEIPEYEYDAVPYLTGAIQRVGVTLYPVRENATAAGFSVSWNDQYKHAELTRNGILVTLSPNHATFNKNNTQHNMSAPSLLEEGRLYAPVSFFEGLR